jgi:hypothetical protein
MHAIQRETALQRFHQHRIYHLQTHLQRGMDGLDEH